METTKVKIVSTEPGKWHSGKKGEVMECYLERKRIGFPFSSEVDCYIPIEDFGKTPQRFIETWKVKIISHQHVK